MKLATQGLLEQVRENRKRLEEADGEFSQAGFSEVENFLQGLAESESEPSPAAINDDWGISEPPFVVTNPPHRTEETPD